MFDITMCRVLYVVLRLFTILAVGSGGLLEPRSSTFKEESVSLTVRNTSSDGTCICRIEIPATVHCSSTEDKKNEESIRERLADISSRLDHHVNVIDEQDLAIMSLSDDMSSVLDKLERIESGDIVVTRPGYNGFRQEIENMETLLALLRENSTFSTDIVATLEAEVRNMTSVIRTLEDEEGSNNYQLQSEVDSLKRKLLQCQQEDVDERASVFFSYDWDRRGHADSCEKLSNVSAPFTMGGRISTTTRGTWFRDPLKDRRKIYLLTVTSTRYAGGSYSNQAMYANNTVVEFASMKDFQLGRITRRIMLTEYCQGTGMVAYNGSLYYHIWNKRQIAKYDIALGHLLKSELPPDTNVENSGAYKSSSNSDVDFAVDESGLWVIYSTTSSNGVIVISKLDPETLLRMETWRTSVTKTSQGNCFMMCQVLHCTNSYNTHADKINYYFDTKTAVESFIYVPIDSKFLATYALSYNPYDQKLYGWDNGHQVIYQLLFEE